MSKLLNYYQDAKPVYGPDDTDYNYQEPINTDDNGRD